MKKLKFVKLFEEHSLLDTVADTNTEKEYFFEELKKSEIFKKNEDGKYIKQEEIKDSLFRHLHSVMATRCKAYRWRKEDVYDYLNRSGGKPTVLGNDSKFIEMLNYLFDQYKYYTEYPDKLINK
jgi:hypothetical protein